MTTLPGRKAGVLCHVTSLPGPEGIGSLGVDAHRFVDFLADARMSVWQVLPVNPPGPGHSPYAAKSSFAGSPLLVSIEQLVEEGLLDAADAAPPAFDQRRVDFDAVAAWKDEMLRAAFARLDQARRAEVHAFSRSASWWLDEWAVFAALAGEFGPRWQEWPAPLAKHDPAAVQRARDGRRAEFEFHCFVQWCFDRQWASLRGHATRAAVDLFGDVPVFPALQSADVWADQARFKLDPDGMPEVVAGVPPDLFSATGQRWGNPHYRWEREAADKFSFWKRRMRRTFELYDIVRIDHFRGFEAAWEIPAGEPTAMHGRWEPGPGRALFDALGEELGDLPIVVEDLGVITDEVRALRDGLGFPGMLVLQFAFDGGEGNPYRPAHHPVNAVVYPGTHDNDTTVGWWRKASGAERHAARQLTGRGFRQPARDLVRAAFASPASLAIATMQDLLELGSEARMNTPGTPDGNWAWRFGWEVVPEGLRQRLQRWIVSSGRA